MSGQYKRYQFPTILNGDVFILNTRKGILTQLAGDEIKEQQILSEGEMYMLLELFENYPDYCPLEVLLSAQSNEELERCREQVVLALDTGTIDALMRQTRNTLSRCRIKLRPFGMEITALLETGYTLTRLKRHGRSQRHNGSRAEKEE
jgi:hypothetical protein